MFSDNSTTYYNLLNQSVTNLPINFSFEWINFLQNENEDLTQRKLL